MNTVLRGANVVDGSGAPARQLDVGLQGGRIAEVGEVGDRGAHEVDLTGLVLAPGFIDPHTHYDAQLLWDRDLTPSSWHGVTTVVTGNCGFSLAPTRASDRGTILGTLENVEDMDRTALAEGISWEFETFAEYLDAVAAEPSRLNVACLVGHTALRVFAMGDAALERPADEAEVEAMALELRRAIDSGALGLATSRSSSHVGDRGRPVASRVADLTEMQRLVDVLDEAPGSVLQIAAGAGLDEVSTLARDNGVPITWSALLTGRYAPTTAVEMVERTAAIRAGVLPQVACRPILVELSLLEPRTLAAIPVMAEVLAAPPDRRRDLFTDPAWTARARSELEDRWRGRWSKVVVASSRAHPDLEGRSVEQVAAERGTTPFDAMLAVALDDDLTTRFSIVQLNDDEDEIAQLLQDDRTLLGLSDAGAHASQLCDACYATHLLGHWVRERDALSLEKAVWKLTGQPAEFLGFGDRGLVRPGYAADLVAFDPRTVGPGPAERVRDLPGRAERLVVRAAGIEHVWVAGEPIVRDGTPVPGARPGRLIRARGSGEAPGAH